MLMNEGWHSVRSVLGRRIRYRVWADLGGRNWVKTVDVTERSDSAALLAQVEAPGSYIESCRLRRVRVWCRV